MKRKILLGLGIALLLVGMSGISSASLTTNGKEVKNEMEK